MKLVKRGEIFHLDLDPTKGREQRGQRFVFVLSPADEDLAIVLPISQGITLARNQGFAVTLTIGLIVSMFTAVVVTRLVFDYVLMTRPVAKLSI